MSSASTVARFCTRSDADGHLQRLRQLIPDASFMVVFDCQREEVAIALFGVRVRSLIIALSKWVKLNLR
ncbi:hypothetical protein H6G27_22550 [Nostoc linckia FACHB-104]|nr:hypothetical protein [Nostoc linckia FACHB-104]